MHLIRLNVNSRLCTCGLIDHGPVLGITHDYILGSESAQIVDNPANSNPFAMFPWSSSIPSWPTPPHSSPTAPSPTAPTTWTTSHLVPTPHNALQHSAPLHGLHGPTSTTPTSTPMLTPGPAEHFFGSTF